MPLLEARGLVKRFPLGTWLSGRGELSAVDGVDLELRRGECLAIVGESGCGKTTLGRCLVGLVEPTAGEVRFDGLPLGDLSAADLRRTRKRFQMVFQDADGALDPRMRVGRSLAEPLAVHRLVSAAERPSRVRELLARVGLPAEISERYPHQLSGGQRQRVGIARALATDPDLLVADEPVSGLDVSVRGQVLGLLADLQRDLGLALLLIAHDLAMVERVADRVAVMYLGRIVETAPASALFSSPRHPYTAGLIASVPSLDPTALGVSGDDSDRDPARRTSGSPASNRPQGAEPEAVADRRPVGCRYAPRCPKVEPRCREEDPQLAAEAEARAVACFFPGPVSRSVPAGRSRGTGSRGVSWPSAGEPADSA